MKKISVYNTCACIFIIQVWTWYMYIGISLNFKIRTFSQWSTFYGWSTFCHIRAPMIVQILNYQDNFIYIYRSNTIRSTQNDKSSNLGPSESQQMPFTWNLYSFVPHEILSFTVSHVICIQKGFTVTTFLLIQKGQIASTIYLYM